MSVSGRAGGMGARSGAGQWQEEPEHRAGRCQWGHVDLRDQQWSCAGRLARHPLPRRIHVSTSLYRKGNKT